MNNTKAAIEEIHRQQAQGCCICAKVQWAEEGEASTKYFFNLEKSKGQSRSFSAIRTVNGILFLSRFSLMYPQAIYRLLLLNK